jgi:hypothetical protein
VTAIVVAVPIVIVVVKPSPLRINNITGSLPDKVRVRSATVQSI